jgi:biotin synthase
MRESPEYVRLSLAAAMTLRLLPGRFFRGAKLYCINLLLTYAEGCLGNCSYCGLSRQREGEYNQKSFIRVDWPSFSLETIIERMNRDYCKHVERVCLSMITHKRALKDTIFITKLLKEKVKVPISLLINPTIISKENLGELKFWGADMVGIAIDAATKDIFETHRGKGVSGPHKWEKFWEILEASSEVFGRDKFGAHLIVGLGEKEEEMVYTIQKVRDLGGTTHLFSFYPEKGSHLSDRDPCEVSKFRRVQLARYLIDKDISNYSKMIFDDLGRIIDFGIKKKRIEEIIMLGTPFQTSGCPGKEMEGACNRPFGDGPPSDIRSYPFKLNKLDLRKIKRQLNYFSK